MHRKPETPSTKTKYPKRPNLEVDEKTTIHKDLEDEKKSIIRTTELMRHTKIDNKNV